MCCVHVYGEKAKHGTTHRHGSTGALGRGCRAGECGVGGADCVGMAGYLNQLGRHSGLTSVNVCVENTWLRRAPAAVMGCHSVIQSKSFTVYGVQPVDQTRCIGGMDTVHIGYV